MGKQKEQIEEKKESRIKSKFGKCYKFRLYPDEFIENKLFKHLNQCRLLYNNLIFGIDMQERRFKRDFYLDNKGNYFIYDAKENEPKRYIWTKYYNGGGFDLKRKPYTIQEQKEFASDTKKEIYFKRVKECENYKKLYGVFEKYFPDCVKSKVDRGNTQKICTYYTNVLSPKSKEDYYVSSLRYENWKLFRQRKSLFSNARGGRKIGRLKYKSKEKFDSFTYNDSGFKFIRTGKRFDILYLSKIGFIKILAHREFNYKEIQSVIIKKEGNLWTARLITCSNEEPKKIKVKGRKKRIGLDMGLGSFVYDSEGKYWDRPKIMEKYEKKIAIYNKKLSKAKRGSNRRKNIRLLLNNTYAKRTRAREDYLHKVSYYYPQNYKEVVIEDLKISEMVSKKGKGKRNKKMRSHIHDASWGKFFDMLEYKLKERGGRLIRVDPKNTSKTCSKCGNIKEDLKLSDRKYVCNKCGLEIDRDYNAALNILKRSYTQELGPLVKKTKGVLVEKSLKT